MPISIPKSIEILTSVRNHPSTAIRMGFPDAAQLGIEALKRIQKQRRYMLVFIHETLPSETEGVTNEHS